MSTTFMLPTKAAELSKDFVVKPMPDDDPQLIAAIAGYIAAWKLPPDSKPSAERWMGVTKDDKLVLVVGERLKDGGTVLEVTDLYTVPGSGRAAVLAIYSVLNVYRMSLALGIYAALMATCLYHNKSFQRAIERVFGVEPTAVFYVAEGK